MLSEIGKYLADPETTEKRYRKDAVNKTLGPEPPQPCPPPMGQPTQDIECNQANQTEPARPMRAR